MKVRTRFAPSPTGYMHIGNLRTALFEYLVAKSQGGDFVLRIEDTDSNRKVDGSVDVIFNTMKIAGLQYDEGPDIGGPYGPYIQSQRKCCYLDYAKMLIEKGEAYYCFCTKDRLDSLSTDANGEFKKYDRFCLNLSDEEIAEKLNAGVPYVIRQRIPEGKTTFVDEVYGSITVDNADLDDQILIKSDGMPTYNFANVIDDHLMNITHVVRGCEYLASTPKYNLLYNAFGWDIPSYIHLPLVLNSDGNKLSKRRGDASFEDLLEEGFLPEAIINYIALLGWNPPNDTREMFTLSELEEVFTTKGLSKSPSVFDRKKLTWLNGEYFKRMEPEKFLELARDTICDAIKKCPINVEQIAKMVQTRISFVKDIYEMLDFFDYLPLYGKCLFINKKAKTDISNALEYLHELKELLLSVDNWTNDEIYANVLQLTEKLNVKKNALLWVLRIALSGKEVTPCGATEIAEIIGKEETINRIMIGIELLKVTD